MHRVPEVLEEANHQLAVRPETELHSSLSLLLQPRPYRAIQNSALQCSFSLILQQ